MTENKIPLLTEVYQPKVKPANTKNKAADPTLGITPELIERVTAHVRPRLEAEITTAVLETIRYELKKNLSTDFRPEFDRIQEEIEGNTRDFVDKTKADLKTELPRMYQASAEFVYKELMEKFVALEQNSFEGFDAQVSDRISAATEQVTSQVTTHMQVLQDELKVTLTGQLSDAIEQFKTAAETDAQTQLTETFAELLIAAKEKTSQAFEQQAEAQLKMLQTHLNDVAQKDAEQIEEKISQHLIASDANITEKLSLAEQQIAQRMTSSEEALTQRLSVAQEMLAQQMEQAEANVARKLLSSQETAISTHQATLQEMLEEQFQTIQNNATSNLTTQLQTFREQTVSSHSTQLTREMDLRLAEISQQAEQELSKSLESAKNIALEEMKQNLSSATQKLYTEAADEVRAKFGEEMAVITAMARKEFMSQVNGDLPDVQKVLLENIERLLNEKLPAMEQGLRTELTEEIRALLQKVQFVLP